MEQFAQVLIDSMQPALASLAPEHRVQILETLLNGYVRVALKYQTPAEVAAALRSALESISGE